MSVSSTETNLAASIMRCWWWWWWGGGGSLEFCNTSGGSEKFYSYSSRITKNLQNLKNSQRSPFPVKNGTSLNIIRNKKFSDFMQLSKQHHQIEICETSHFCIMLELVAYKLFLLLKLTGICVTKTGRNVHFGNMKFSWKK